MRRRALHARAAVCTCRLSACEPQGPALTALRASLCINEHIYRKKRQKFQLIPMPVSDSTSVKFPLAGVKNSKNVGGAGIADCNRPEVHCQEFKTVQLDNFLYVSYIIYSLPPSLPPFYLYFQHLASHCMT